LDGNFVEYPETHDEVEKLNHLTEKLSDKTIDLDKRLVRIETLVEVAKYETKIAKIEKGWSTPLHLIRSAYTCRKIVVLRLTQHERLKLYKVKS
jgi:hypothetical protein